MSFQRLRDFGYCGSRAFFIDDGRANDQAPLTSIRLIKPQNRLRLRPGSVEGRCGTASGLYVFLYQCCLIHFKTPDLRAVTAK
jgi:hypothetical protein